MNNSKNFRKAKKNDIWRKANGRCAHCGKEVKRARTLDHYIPKSAGGTWDSRNLFPTCRSCNEMRGSRKVDPRTYYRYATEEAIYDALEYEREFNANRKSASGEKPYKWDNDN